MKNLDMYTGNLIGADVSRLDRAVFLKKLPKAKKQRDCKVAPGVMASQVWGRDVSGSDSRSIKAQLAGRGDLRAFWWNLNSLVHRLFSKDRSLEGAMYTFHSRHHSLTLGRMRFVNDFVEAVRVTRTRGVAAGMEIMREQDRRNSQRD